MRIPTLLLAVALLTGCPSISLLGSARTVDKGSTQLALGLSTNGTVFTRTPMNGTPFNLGGQVELAVRHGVTERVELGGRLWPTGLQADGKVALLRSTAEQRFDLSLAPSLGVVYFPAENRVPSIPLQLAVLGGYSLDAVDLTLGVRLMDRIVFYQGPINTWWGGLNLGLAVRLTDSVRLVPELALLVPLGVSSSEVYFQGGVGVTFGGGGAR